MRADFPSNCIIVNSIFEEICQVWSFQFRFRSHFHRCHHWDGILRKCLDWNTYFWGFLPLIASKENILLWTVSIFCSFWVCARQISHVRNEGNSENLTTRDWWFRETLSIWLIYHFSDLHFFQNKLIFFWCPNLTLNKKSDEKILFLKLLMKIFWSSCFPFEIFII